MLFVAEAGQGSPLIHAGSGAELRVHWGCTQLDTRSDVISRRRTDTSVASFAPIPSPCWFPGPACTGAVIPAPPAPSPAPSLHPIFARSWRPLLSSPAEGRGVVGEKRELVSNAVKKRSPAMHTVGTEGVTRTDLNLILLHRRSRRLVPRLGLYGWGPRKNSARDQEHSHHAVMNDPSPRHAARRVKYCGE